MTNQPARDEMLDFALTAFREVPNPVVSEYANKLADAFAAEVRAAVLAEQPAVSAVAPASTDRAAVLEEAADFLRDAYFRDGLSVQEIGTALRRMAAESVPAVVGRTDRETPEDPARIDRLRPEFFEHASVESIDVQIRRAQTQQRQWGNRARTLTILRQARLMQKELGEWPAGGAQQPKETEAL